MTVQTDTVTADPTQVRGVTPERTAALPQQVRARYTGADGNADAAFNKLYDALQETEPTF